MRLIAAKGLTVFCILCMLTNPAKTAEIWKITSLDWQPYSGSDMKDQGTAIATLRQKLKHEGIDLEVDFQPWARAKHTAKSEAYIGYFPAWPEEVDVGFKASPPIAYSSVAMIAKDPAALNNDLESLFQKEKVGIVLTYVYPENIKELAAKYAGNVSLVQDEETLAAMLYHDKFQVAITDPDVFAYYAQKMGAVDTVVSRVIEKKALVVAVKTNEAGKRNLEVLERALQSK